MRKFEATTTMVHDMDYDGGSSWSRGPEGELKGDPRAGKFVGGSNAFFVGASEFASTM